MSHALANALSSSGKRAQEQYEPLRSMVETPQNIGKLIIIDVDSGDSEIDDWGLVSSRKLRERHPDGDLYALRIGYKAVEALGGILERSEA